jgi:hypothetical protein
MILQKNATVEIIKSVNAISSPSIKVSAITEATINAPFSQFFLEMSKNKMVIEQR